MSSYLEAYGAAEQQRARTFRIVKISSIILACLLVTGLVFYAVFKNHGEEQRAKTFLGLLDARNYAAAYAMWGCTDAKPCAGYSMDAFMQDWGPQKGDPASYRIIRSKSCGSGVILNVDFGNELNILWVQRNDLVIGFSPFPGCPAPTALLGGKAPR